MSIGTYAKARREYIAGDDAALSRMTRAITPAVATRLGQIEHEAAMTRRRLAQVRAEQAAQARTDTNQFGDGALARAAVVIIAVIVAVITLVHLWIATGPRHSAAFNQQQTVQQLPAQQYPLTAGTGPGWVTLYLDGHVIQVMHVRNVRSPVGSTLVAITPWVGQTYLLDPGAMTYMFTQAKPGS
jgi:hypothetical protein